MIAFIFTWLLGCASFAGEPPLPPPRAAELAGKFTALSGPNCWNSALYAAGLVSGIRHVDYDEFTAWLESPLCAEVPESGAESGDIVALRRVSQGGRLVDFPYSAEVHGYLLLSSSIAFTKNGTAKSEGYQFQDISSLHAKYERLNKHECRVLGLPKELCHMKAQYFRCSPSVSAPVGIEGKVLALETHLHRLYSGEYSPESLEDEKLSLKKAADLIEAELNSSDTDNSWKRDLLRLRLMSSRIFQF